MNCGGQIGQGDRGVGRGSSVDRGGDRRGVGRGSSVDRGGDRRGVSKGSSVDRGLARVQGSSQGTEV